MSEALKIMLDNIGRLNMKEKALAAHCLLSAMNSKNSEDADADWLKLAESRSSQLESGLIDGLTWEQIKKEALD